MTMRTGRTPRNRRWLAPITILATIAAAAAAPGARAQASEPPTNVLVSPTASSGALRPWLARNPARPGRLSIAYNVTGVAGTCFLAGSADDGATWQNAPVVGAGGQFALPVGNQCSRPSIAYGPDGTLYYAFSAITRPSGFPPPAVVYVMTSADDGATFTAPVRVEEPGDVKDINPNLAVDQASGRVYVAWQANSPFPANVAIASSGDRGQTFSAAVRPFPKGGGPGAVTVGPDGRVYLAHIQLQDWSGSMGAQPIRAEVASSTNAGQTFGPPVVALDLPSCFSPDNSCQTNGQGAYTFDPSLDFVAGNAPGQVFLVGSYLGEADIFRFRFAGSANAGATWQRTGPIGIPGGLDGDHQIVPNIAVAPDDRIDVAYYDLAEPSGDEDTYLISSSDRGSSFSAPRKISSAVSPTGSDGGNETYTVGKLLVSSNDASYIAWTDARRGGSDIFFARASALAPVSPVSPAAAAPAPTAPTAPATPVSPARDSIRPVVSGLGVFPARFTLGSLLPRLAHVARVGTTIRFSLSERAAVSLSFARRHFGRRVGHACRAATRALRSRPLCNRFVTVLPSVRFAGVRAGANRVRFQGRLSGTRTLLPGHYRLTVRATDPAGNRSKPKRVLLTALAARRRAPTLGSRPGLNGTVGFTG